MKKLAIFLIAISLLLFLNTSNVLAAVTEGQSCHTNATSDDDACGGKGSGFGCVLNNPKTAGDTTKGTCHPSIQVNSPDKGFSSVGNFIDNALTLVFAVAVLIVFIMLIIGAYEWMVSGGDKEAVGKARNRIINALIGLVVLAVAFALTRVLAQFTGLDIGNLIVPTPNPNASGL